MRVIAAFILCLAVSGAVFAQNDAAKRWPVTRAEATEYRETSSHADVWKFIDELKAAGADFVIDSMGFSTEGRNIPLVIAASLPVTSPAAALRSGKPIVYVQGNIHAGEVEGKEVALMLLREIAQGDAKHLLDSMTLLVAPIYNCDGNDAWGPGDRNRPGQNGPERVGKRANGMGLDLNRDCMKAETPEMRGALAHVYTKWDPDVIIDLHTTNGTRHGYALTYSPPLAPATESGIVELSRRLLSTVRRRVRDEHGLELFDYGNYSSRRPPAGWRTFEPHARFVTNYAGVRNRIGLLSEATSYIPFEERVVATRHFLRAILDYLAEHKDAIVAATNAADAKVTGWGANPATAPELGVRFDFDTRGEETILLEDYEGEGRPRGKPEKIKEVQSIIFDRFKATRTAKLPAAYWIPEAHENVVELLLRHGVVVEKLKQEWEGSVAAFGITETNTRTREFQGHKLHQLDGDFELGPAKIQAGSYLVRTAQPLGLLIFQMLEPESPDGATAWGFFGDSIRNGAEHPVRKSFNAVSAVTKSVRR